jgi:hypothetical protein
MLGRHVFVQPNIKPLNSDDMSWSNPMFRLARLAPRFRLQAYLGATIIDSMESSVLDFVTDWWLELGWSISRV